jgi:phosphoribosylaminoimidazole (AIR) synthetase
MGVGFALVLPEASVDAAQATLAAAGVASWDCGVVEPGGAGVTLVGEHA